MDKYIIRKHYGKGFKYYNKRDNEIKMTPELKGYINSIYIPPAYKDVKINLKKRDDVYAIGTDNKGRKQYLYRKKHTENSAREKFTSMIEFGKVYPKIKHDIKRFLNMNKDTNEHQIGIALKLMIDCNFRVGNDIYQKDNNSFGTTTLQGRHIHKTDNGGIEISFTGKKGVKNTAKVKDKRLIKSLKKMRGGQRNIFSIDSNDINKFLKTYGDFSSKDIRTWQANISFIKKICYYHQLQSNVKNILKLASEKTAEKLHHTPTISKKSYIFCELANAYAKEPVKFYNYFKHNPEKQFILFLNKHI